MSEEKNGVDLNGIQVVSSALAAVSSAVLLSTVGVAGTVIGAAAGSVIATVGGAVYSYSLRTSRARVAAAQALAASRVRAARTGHHPSPGDKAAGESGAHQSTDLYDEEPGVAASGPADPRRLLAGLPWKAVSLATVGVFGVVMAAIFAFEVFTGHPVSAYTGGSPRHDSGTSFTGTQKSSPTPTPSPTSTTSPTESTSPSAPETTSPSESMSPSESPTSTPTETPTETPTDGESESPSTTPSETPTSEATSTPDE